MENKVYYREPESIVENGRIYSSPGGYVIPGTCVQIEVLDREMTEAEQYKLKMAVFEKVNIMVPPGTYDALLRIRNTPPRPEEPNSEAPTQQSECFELTPHLAKRVGPDTIQFLANWTIATTIRKHNFVKWEHIAHRHYAMTRMPLMKERGFNCTTARSHHSADPCIAIGKIFIREVGNVKVGNKFYATWMEWDGERERLEFKL